MKDFPVRVMLRNTSKAVVKQRVHDTEPMVLLGFTELDGQSQLWREDGRFREDGAAHPLDIVGLFDANGKPFAYAAAAGAKGEAP